MSSIDLSDSSASSSSGESLDEFHRDIPQARVVLGYQFEPRQESNSASGESADIEEEINNISVDGEELLVHLGNLNW